MNATLNNALGNLINSKIAQDQFASKDADASLTVNETVVHVTGFSAGVTITLPFAADAVGRFYAIKVLDDASVNNVVVQDNDESRNWSDLTCSNASGGWLLLYCDGEQFYNIATSNFA